MAARRIAWGRLLNSGQTCVAPDYVLAEKSIAEEFVRLIVDTVDTFHAGRDAGMRIVNERQFDGLVGYLGATRGEIAVGGGSDRDSLTIEPTIIVGPDPREPAMVDEIFGPILPVIAVDSVDEAIRFVNGRPKPLALYVFSGSKATSRRIIDSVPAGGAVVNTTWQCTYWCLSSRSVAWGRAEWALTTVSGGFGR